MNHYPNFNDKVALVTGAGSGMGLAIARAFGEAGASVALADVKAETVRKAAERLVSEGCRALVDTQIARDVVSWERAGVCRAGEAGSHRPRGQARGDRLSRAVALQSLGVSYVGGSRPHSGWRSDCGVIAA